MVYNSQHSFLKFKDISEFKELSLDSMYRKLKNFHKKIADLKNVTPRTEANKNLKNNAEVLFNDLYYIYKDKYNEEKNNLNTKNKKKFDYKKLRLTDDYQFESEEEQEQPDTTDMPELESEESTTQKNEGHGLKILTPIQMLSIIPISLAQLEAGNN